jgi:hypothetical protein
MEKDNTLIRSLLNFLEDTEGLSDEDLIAELHAQGIDVTRLQKRVEEVVRQGSEKRRLAWREAARQKRLDIEESLRRKEAPALAADLMRKITDILAGYYGPAALSHAQAFFHKKETITEKDLKSLIEDLEDLNFLHKFSKEE